MTRRVRLSDRADRDVWRSLAWLTAEYGRAYAEKWYDRLRTSVTALATDADQWPEAAEAEWIGRKIRQKLVGRKRQMYRVLFEITGDGVHVHRIRHIGQDYLTADDL